MKHIFFQIKIITLETVGFFNEEDVIAAAVTGSTVGNIVDNSPEANEINLNWQNEFGVSIDHMQYILDECKNLSDRDKPRQQKRKEIVTRSIPNSYIKFRSLTPGQYNTFTDFWKLLSEDTRTRIKVTVQTKILNEQLQEDVSREGTEDHLKNYQIRLMHLRVFPDVSAFWSSALGTMDRQTLDACHSHESAASARDLDPWNKIAEVYNRRWPHTDDTPNFFQPENLALKYIDGTIKIPIEVSVIIVIIKVFRYFFYRTLLIL